VLLAPRWWRRGSTSAGDAGGRAGRRRGVHLPISARPSAPSAAGAGGRSPPVAARRAARCSCRPVRPTTAIEAASRHDDEAFSSASAASGARPATALHPLATLLFSGTDETKVERWPRGSRRRSRAGGGGRRHAPRPGAPGAGRLRGRHRWHLLLKAGSAARLHDVRASPPAPRARRIGPGCGRGTHRGRRWIGGCAVGASRGRHKPPRSRADAAATHSSTRPEHPALPLDASRFAD